jgi:hypothetical protein
VPGSIVHGLNTLGSAAAVIVVIISSSSAQPSFVIGFGRQNNGKQEGDNNGNETSAPAAPWSRQHPEPVRQQSCHQQQDNDNPDAMAATPQEASRAPPQ